MDLDSSQNFGSIPNSAEDNPEIFPPASEKEFRKEENISEPFGSIPQKGTERFGRMQNPSFRTEYHTLTVREVAKMFEEAGVTRTERSIVNWCNPNKHGIARLDAYYEPNERKYYITPQSVHRVIKEEQSKERKNNYLPENLSEQTENFSESFRSMNENDSERFGSISNASEKSSGSVPHHSEKFRTLSEEEELQKDKRLKELEEVNKELEFKNRDLEINNRAKDKYIERLEKDREMFVEERKTLVNQLIDMSTKFLGLMAPKERDKAQEKKEASSHPNYQHADEEGEHRRTFYD